MMAWLLLVFLLETVGTNEKRQDEEDTKCFVKTVRLREYSVLHAFARCSLFFALL